MLVTTKPLLQNKGSQVHTIRKNGPLQHFAADLAGMLVPVATVFTADGVNFFSKTASSHPDFDKYITPEDRAAFFFLLGYILDDFDKPGLRTHHGNPNIQGGISFDFDQAQFKSNSHMITLISKDVLKSFTLETVQMIHKRVVDFQNTIQGAEGLVVLQHGMDNAHYTANTAQNVQKVLLGRCKFVLDITQKELHKRLSLVQKAKHLFGKFL